MGRREVPNFLEQLVAEYFEYQGFFVRRNVMVGRRARGGYECELDVVAYHPAKKRLVHVEPSMDAQTWEKREGRYRKKFTAGRKHIPSLFDGVTLPSEPEQIALFGFGTSGGRTTLAGGRVVMIADFMREIAAELRGKKISNAAVPEAFPLLRAVQFTLQYLVQSTGVPRD